MSKHLSNAVLMVGTFLWDGYSKNNSWLYMETNCWNILNKLFIINIPDYIEYDGVDYALI